MMTEYHHDLPLFETVADKEIASLKAKIAELDKERVELQSYAVRVVTFIICAVEKLRDIPEFKPTGDVLNRAIKLTPKIALEAHNLEQQAKILKQLAREAYTDTKEGCTYHMLLTQKALELTRQAKQLREGVQP